MKLFPQESTSTFWRCRGSDAFHLTLWTNCRSDWTHLCEMVQTKMPKEMIKENLGVSYITVTSPTFGPFYVCQNPNLRCLNKSTLASLQGFSCHRMNGKVLHLGDRGECKQFLDRISPQLHHLVAVRWNTLRYTERNTRRASSSPASEVSPPGSRSSMA